MSITRLPSAALNPLAVFDRILASIELTQAQYEEAKTSYEALGKVLASSPSLNGKYNSDIFPQGSMRLGTTIRPVGEDHFDLDMICWIAVDGRYLTPAEVYDLVWNAIGEHETYRGLRTKKNRCIRIAYADSRKFHLDITPAIPTWLNSSGALYVPDREKRQWCSSHPKGYADAWFKPATENLPLIGVKATAANERLIFENRAHIEEMSPYGDFEKKPLQRIVQLLKRSRDEHFQELPEYRPSSILLTTIIAHAYLASVTNRFENLFEFVQAVIAKLPQYVGRDATGSHYSVPNPINSSENFAEAWTPEHYAHFVQWHAGAMTLMSDLANLKGKGTDLLLERIGTTFNRDQVLAAANGLGLDTHKLHENRGLRFGVNTAGVSGLASAVIPKTIYFGK